MQRRQQVFPACSLPPDRTRGAGRVAQSVAAFSITQDSVITLWNVVLGAAVMVWAFGFERTCELLSRKARKQAAADG
jgi:hypothetical protein